MSTLFWMLLEGVHLYLQIVVVFVIKKRIENPANVFAFGWLTPFFITITQSSIFANRFGETDICWLSPSDGSIWAFAGPALVILIANLILKREFQYWLFYLAWGLFNWKGPWPLFDNVERSINYRFLTILYTIKIVWKMVTIVWVIWNLEYHQQNAVPKKMRTTLRSLIFLYPIMGSTWLFGLFSFSHHSPFVYQYLFSLFNAFQGVFMLLFHCLLQPGNILTFRCKCAVNYRRVCFKHSCSYYWYNIEKTSKFPIPLANEFHQNIYLEIFDKLCSSGTRWRLRGILTCQINPLKKPMKALPPSPPENEQELRKIEYRKSPENPLMLDKKPLAPLVPKEISKDIKPKTTNPQVKLFF